MNGTFDIHPNKSLVSQPDDLSIYLFNLMFILTTRFMFTFNLFKDLKYSCYILIEMVPCRNFLEIFYFLWYVTQELRNLTKFDWFPVKSRHFSKKHSKEL